jgi:type I restriction enzyme S subunit
MILLSDYIRKTFWDLLSGFNSPSITHAQFQTTLIPLPPLPEQNRIVKKLEELMKLCDDLQASKEQNEMLLQGALRDALRKEEVTVQ